MDEIYRELLHQCFGFDWDKGNVDKNWLKHKVSPSECEQIFFQPPLIDPRRHNTFSDGEKILCAWENRLEKSPLYCIYC